MLNGSLRILIADDHEAVREGLKKIIEERPSWKVVAVARDGREAIDKAVETAPDVAIVDYSMPVMNGIEAAQEIRAQLPQTEVLIFTIHNTEDLLVQVLRSGARGYVLKTDAKRDLLAAVEALASRKPFFTPQIPEPLLDSYAARSRRVPGLTTRERDIVRLLAAGHTSTVVADMLHISKRTVETHRAAVMQKLNLSSFASLVRYAVRNQLVQP